MDKVSGNNPTLSRPRAGPLSRASAPVKLETMGKWLGLYPNKRDANFVRCFLSSGSACLLQARCPCVRTEPSIRPSFADCVAGKVDRELRLSRMEGPFKSIPVDDLVISPVRVVPKKTPGAFRLIQHFSYPPRASVSDAIPPAHCSVVYQSFDETLGMVRSYGSGALMAKIDVESAFRLLRHPVYQFWGNEIDTVAGECSPPQDEVSKLRETIRRFNGSRKVTLRQAQSVRGMLNFACRVIPMGRVFCRKLDRAAAGCARPHHFVRLSSELKRDLAVWASFLEEFNGVSIWQAPAIDSESLQFFTNAAGSSGFGCLL
ncbi:uncharacterized protein LOC135004924 isoform X1 [Pseudophryne corroboree]|uniref:uncharacterized protein LOC135004924 isoform X1 n=1 Tax=Pseudophryne corroboree TaxID=495146 RepID=UPI0030817097